MSQMMMMMMMKIFYEPEMVNNAEETASPNTTGLIQI